MSIGPSALYARYLLRRIQEHKPQLFTMHAAVLPKRAGSARAALEEAGAYPHWNHVYAAYREEIERAYAEAGEALVLHVEPHELTLLPASVRGGLDPDEPGLIDPPAEGLPPLVPPAAALTLPPARVDPELEAAKRVFRIDPRSTAASVALRRATFARWPNLTVEELAAAPKALYWLPQVGGLEEAGYWITAALVYDALAVREPELDRAIRSRAPGIARQMLTAPTAVVALRLRGETQVFVERPDPTTDEAPTTLVAPGRDRAIDDLLLEARANHPSEGVLVYAVLLHRDDPHLKRKLELVRARVPDAQVLELLSGATRRVRHPGSVLFFEIQKPDGERQGFISKVLIPVRPRSPEEEVLFPNPTA